MNDINNSLKMEIQSDVFITLIKHLQDNEHCKISSK